MSWWPLFDVWIWGVGGGGFHFFIMCAVQMFDKDFRLKDAKNSY
jgi:hypothetical protein